MQTLSSTWFRTLFLLDGDKRFDCHHRTHCSGGQSSFGLKTLCLPKQDAAPPKAKMGEVFFTLLLSSFSLLERVSIDFFSCLHLSALESPFYSFSLCVLPEFVEFSKQLATWNSPFQGFRAAAAAGDSSIQKEIKQWANEHITPMHYLTCHRWTKLLMLM